MITKIRSHLNNNSYEDRAGHDCHYAIDASTLEAGLGWKADKNFDTGITKQIKWHLNKFRK